MTDEPNEVTEMWREHRHHRQQKRADNRQAGAERLTAEGIPFLARNDGAHLIVMATTASVIDYWPGTGKWNERGSSISDRGIGALLRFVGRRRRKSQVSHD